MTIAANYREINVWLFVACGNFSVSLAKSVNDYLLSEVECINQQDPKIGVAAALYLRRCETKDADLRHGLFPYRVYNIQADDMRTRVLYLFCVPKDWCTRLLKRWLLARTVSFPDDDPLLDHLHSSDDLAHFWEFVYFDVQWLKYYHFSKLQHYEHSELCAHVEIGKNTRIVYFHRQRRFSNLLTGL